MSLMLFITATLVTAGVATDLKQREVTPPSYHSERLSTYITKHTTRDHNGITICYEDRSIMPTLWECWNE